MDKKLKTDYENSLKFWETTFANSLNREEQDNSDKNNWKYLAPSEKFIEALSSFSNNKKVLDYGCGDGWASIIIAKFGCKNIYSVDLSKSAIKKTQDNIKIFDVKNSIKSKVISEDWINSEKSEKYDGFFCSNVIDVVPEEISNNILKQANRIVKPKSKVIISLNFYLDTKLNINHQHEIKGKYLYRDGILRMVNRTDQEWKDIFSKYFSIEKIVHFSWPGETKETRRLFYLIKK